MHRFANLFFILLLSVLSACGGGGDTASPSPTPTPLPIQVGTIKGTAFAVDTAAPLANAKVSVGEVSTTTANDGSFTLNNVPAQERAVVKFEAPDYSAAFSAVAVVDKQTSATQGLLIKVGATSTFAANTASTLTVPSSPAQVALTADSLVNAATGAAASGTITAKITPIDPASNPQSMPGDYTALTAAGAVQSIESFGAVNVELKDAAGNKLNLATGKSATIRIAVSSRTAAANNPATIPLYYFNETNGRWVQEGTATLSADKTYYEGTVTHFSTWNCDRPAETIFVTGCVVDLAGNLGISGATVNSTGVDYSGSANTLTDSLGNFRVAIKKDAIANIQARILQANGNIFYSNIVTVGPSSVDIKLPSCQTLSGVVDYAPKFTQQPADITALPGDRVYFFGYAFCINPAKYQWYRNGVLIPNATQVFYALTMVLDDNGAKYTVVVTCSAPNNPTGISVTSNPGTLTVLPGPIAPTITKQPADQTIPLGDYATFSVTATGTPAPNFQWYRNNVAIPGEINSSYSLGPVVATDTLSEYKVVVSNTGGSVTSSVALLTVILPTLPSFTTQPVSQTVFVGQTATFTVAATGTALLTYQWYRNDVLVADTLLPIYITPITTLADNGAVYTVKVTNRAGSVTSSSATLTVQAVTQAPVITRQPTSLTVYQEDPGFFGVSVSQPALSKFQWLRNGTPIPGATTSFYVTPATTAADNGARFSVVVTNAAGSLTSSEAILTVRTTTATQRDALSKLIFLPFLFTSNAGAAGDLVDTLTFLSPQSLCTGGGGIAATFDGAALPAAGTQVPAGSHTLAATFNACVNTTLRTTQNGNSSFAYNFSDALNGTTTFTAVNMRESEADQAAKVIFDTTANGAVSASQTGSLAGTLETRNSNFTIANGATYKNNLNGNLATFTSGSVTTNQVQELAPKNPLDYPLLRNKIAYSSLAYTLGTVNYVVNGLTETVYEPVSKIFTNTGEITITGNGVQAGRIYYLNNELVFEVTSIPQIFGQQAPAKLLGRAGIKF